MHILTRVGPVVGIGILLVLTACSSGDALGPNAAQGIEGLALLGPQCPVETLEDPCPDLPHQARIDVLKARLLPACNPGMMDGFELVFIPGPTSSTQNLGILFRSPVRSTWKSRKAFSRK